MVHLNHIPTQLHIAFESSRRILSSAILNGGLIRAHHIINMKVPKRIAVEQSSFETPKDTLSSYRHSNPYSGQTATGTDPIAVARSYGPPEIKYCGQHVLFGEMLAAAPIWAITESLGYRL